MSTLKVYPNPWAARDKHGIPCGVCPRDPESDGGGPGQFVGARVSRKQTKVLQDFGKLAPHELRSPMQRTAYEYMGIAADDAALAQKLFAGEPVEVPRSKYYKDRIADGSLFAADKATADVCRRRFVPLDQLSARFAVPVTEGVNLPADGTTAEVALEASPALAAHAELQPIIASEG